MVISCGTSCGTSCGNYHRVPQEVFILVEVVTGLVEFIDFILIVLILLYTYYFALNIKKYFFC